jgi:hypothetical protein
MSHLIITYFLNRLKHLAPNASFFVPKKKNIAIPSLNYYFFSNNKTNVLSFLYTYLYRSISTLLFVFFSRITMLAWNGGCCLFSNVSSTNYAISSKTLLGILLLRRKEMLIQQYVSLKGCFIATLALPISSTNLQCNYSN